ncbi:MAG: cupin domain-containing protein [Halioglobus sp.]|nr:cupin domain-containing protein [Halioglobus sp.]
MSSDWELNLDKEQFLAQHWQKAPLLIRGAIKNFKPPISSDELAGLAYEEEVEARIVEHQEDNWHLFHGPFSATDYQRKHPWTLLVQAVDQYIPEVAQLRKLVDFIPQWRVDDVMASYASDGGSVGPHFDNYDVFLLQGEGHRLWKTGQFCDSNSPLVDHDSLRLLSQFNTEAEYLLEPGDILYVPPGIAHWGTAQGECTTFSIGFRAPRITEMVSRFTDALIEQLDPDLFYSDARIEVATRPGEIRPRDLDRVSAQIQAALDQSEVNHWFGELATEPRYEQFPDEGELSEARLQLSDGANGIELNSAAKLAWQHEAGRVVVFANGDSRSFSESIMPLQIALSDAWKLDKAELAAASADPESSGWLDYLLESGCVFIL